MSRAPEAGPVRADWTRRADAWNRWSAHLAKASARFNRPLLEAAGAGPGTDLLDLASGTGEPSLTAARAEGAGFVVATDLVPAMLEGCRRRAREEGLDRLLPAACDMQLLPFADASFGAVTARFGIMFVPEPGRAAAEAFRVLRPGGRAAFMAWGPEEDTTMFRVLRGVMRREEAFRDAPELAFPFRFGTPGMLRDLLAGAGFADVVEEEFRFGTRIEAGERFWEPHLEMSLGRHLGEMTAAEREAFEGEIRRAFADLEKDGTIELGAHVRIGAGTRPRRDGSGNG